MNLLSQLTVRAEGDALQGKLMIVLGIIGIFGLVFILKARVPFFKVLMIPGILFSFISMGYGVFLATVRVRYIQTAKKRSGINELEFLRSELQKARTSNRNYRITKTSWLVLAVVSAGLIFCFSEMDFSRGLSLGMALLFAISFGYDFFLHRRLKSYLSNIEKYNSIA